MLIKSLEAHNFRKYETLTVNDLPEYGLIAISGLNESGKSSIGEAIFFALFGRIFNIDETGLKKLIRWGADNASVKLTILGNSNEAFQIHRTIDEKGGSDATLTRLKDGKLISTGINATNEAIVKMLGYDYATFSDSAFLVARDLSNPDPDSSSIKQMAGIGDYSKISDELTASGAINKGSAKQVLPEIKKRQQALDALDIDENWLPELIDAREVVNAENQKKQNLSGELAEFSSLYQDKQKQHKRTRRGWSFFNALTWILIPLMLIAWGLWIAFNFFPAFVQKLSTHDNLSPTINKLEGLVSESGFVVTMALVLIASLALIFKWRSEYKIDHQLAEAEKLSATLGESHAHSQRSLDGLMTARLRHTLQGRIQPQSALSAPPQDDNQRLQKLTKQTLNYSADSNEISNTVKRLRDTLDLQQKELSDFHKPLEASISNEKDRSDEAGSIRSGLQNLQQQLRADERQILLNETGIKMLQRASEKLIIDFNASITDRTEKTMPLFTENRYKQIRISKDLSVLVYSEEKMDWVDFDEVSSGTKRQILLAVRIAMVEQLAKNTGNEKQFLFLDEPFTYFDQDRTKAALAALPKVSEVVCQTWIVAQEFPADSHTDKQIHCPDTGNHILEI